MPSPNSQCRGRAQGGRGQDQGSAGRSGGFPRSEARGDTAGVPHSSGTYWWGQGAMSTTSAVAGCGEFGARQRPCCVVGKDSDVWNLTRVRLGVQATACRTVAVPACQGRQYRRPGRPMLNTGSSWTCIVLQVSKREWQWNAVLILASFLTSQDPGPP